jgi:hypothetical protein
MLDRRDRTVALMTAADTSSSFRRKPESILILAQEQKWIPAFAGMTK